MLRSEFRTKFSIRHARSRRRTIKNNRWQRPVYSYVLVRLLGRDLGEAMGDARSRWSTLNSEAQIEHDGAAARKKRRGGDVPRAKEVRKQIATRNAKTESLNKELEEIYARNEPSPERRKRLHDAAVRRARLAFSEARDLENAMHGETFQPVLQALAQVLQA